MSSGSRMTRSTCSGGLSEVGKTRYAAPTELEVMVCCSVLEISRAYGPQYTDRERLTNFRKALPLTGLMGRVLHRLLQRCRP